MKVMCEQSMKSSYNIEKPIYRFPLKNCSNLIFLSAIACQLADCLSEEAIAVLSADLVVLSDMLANINTRKEICSPKEVVPECMIENE